MADPRVTISGDHTKAMSKAVALANVRALKRAIITTRAHVSSALNKDTGVRVKTIKRHISITNPTPDVQEASLRIDGVPVPAIEYRAKQLAAGVMLSTRAFLKGAFIAETKSGHRAVWSRHRPSRSRKNKPRSSPALPIFQRFGPPLSIVALRTDVLRSGLVVGRESFRKNLEHELQRLGAGAS